MFSLSTYPSCMSRSLFATVVLVAAVAVYGALAAREGARRGLIDDLPGASAAATPPKPAGTDMKPSTTKHSYSRAGWDITPYSKAKVEELAAKLTPEQFRVTQKAGTEPAFCGNLLDNKKDGTYCCIVCGLPLFTSAHKFNSGTGWPSFYTTFDPLHVAERPDSSHGMERTEINCARCGAHLGHVFEDGPRPTGLRYCLNSASLQFVDKGQPWPAGGEPVKTETAYFAGGCFWGVEHIFQQAPGVISAESGYQQGKTKDPTYKEVCTDTTGHAESVKVVFDPTVITYKQLLEGFFQLHDPTTLNRQGPDVGEQYRSAVFCTSPQQLEQAKAFVADLTARNAFTKPIVTQVEMARDFYPAEEYHQDYVEKTGRACHNVNPWPAIFGTAAAGKPSGH
jgi:peptide methionine sulfoxide reductase msrA/msrB